MSNELTVENEKLRAEVEELQAKLTQQFSSILGDNPKHGPGTIALPCNDLSRYSSFTLSLATMNLPIGTQIAMVRSMDVTANLNAILNEMLRPQDEWVWFIGDDHTFEEDILTRLLDHEVDVVVPLVAKKNPPFRLVLFSGEEMMTYETDGREYPHYTYMDMEDLPPSGLAEVYACGSAGMLVRREVIDAVGAISPNAWFENPHGTVVNDDLEFCRKIRESGYKIHADTDTTMGHIGMVNVYPGKRDGTWGLYLDFGSQSGGENRIFMATAPVKIRENEGGLIPSVS